MSDLNLEQFNEFKEALASLKFPKVIPQTFLEIIDLHRIEAVSSKVLAFVFDSDADHGLGNLGLQALIQAAGIKKKRIPKTVEVITEFSCKLKQGGRKGRIDIVVELQDQLIVIENKIAHSLNNPFDLYIKQCEKSYKHIPIEQHHFILLGNSKPTASHAGFKFVSHSDFGKALKSHLSQQADDIKSNYYYTFLLDYIEAMESMNPKSFDPALLDVIEFCQENYEQLERLTAQRDEICDYSKKKLMYTFEKLESNINFPDAMLKLNNNDQIEWRWLGAYSSSEVIKLKSIKYDVYLLAQCFLKDVYVTIQMYKRNTDTEIDHDEVMAVLESQLLAKQIKAKLDVDLEEIVLYKKSAKNLNVAQFAKQIDKFYRQLQSYDE